LNLADASLDAGEHREKDREDERNRQSDYNSVRQPVRKHKILYGAQRLHWPLNDQPAGNHDNKNKSYYRPKKQEVFIVQFYVDDNFPMRRSDQRDKNIDNYRHEEWLIGAPRRRTAANRQPRY
jgi:hypothetical protein